MTNVGIKMTLDASQVASVANTTKDAFLGMADAMKKAQEAGDYKTVSDLAGGMKDLRSASGGVVNSNQAQQAQQGRQNAAFANGIVSTVNQAPGMVNMLGRGDFAGTAISGIQGAGGLSRSVGKSIGENAKEGSGMDQMAGVLKFLGVGALVGGGLAAGANALSEQWEKVMQPTMDMTAMLKNNAGTAEEGSQKIRQAFDFAAKAANEFGFSAEEGVKVVTDLARYGRTDENGVYESENKVLKYARTTGASIGALTKYEGSMLRYGGGSNSLGLAYGGTLASGLQKGQFEEFLTSVERIFQEGISKGFVKGAQEITSDLTFLSKLSGGNDLWKGEQGAQRYSQMSNAISNGTNLASVSDILTFRAASALDLTKYDKQVDILDENGKPTGKKESEWQKMYHSKRGGDYVDQMLIMEKGLSPELLKQQMKLVRGLEGEDNRTGQIERYRQMFGLNYTGAAQLYDMLGNKPDFESKDFKEQVNKLAKDPEFKSNENKLLTETEKISTDVALIGSKFADMKVGVFSGIESTVSSIRDFLIGGHYGKGVDIVAGMFTGAEWNSYGKKIGSYIDDGMKAEENTQKHKEMEPIAKWFSERTPEERDKLNSSNVLNVASYSEFVKAAQGIMANGIPAVGGMTLGEIDSTVESLIANKKTNWQTKTLLQALNVKIDNPKSSPDDSLESQMIYMMHDRFATQEGLSNFINSDLFHGVSNEYESTKSGKAKFTDDQILDALKKALQAYNGVSLSSSPFHLGSDESDVKDFVPAWNSPGRAGKNIDSLQVASSDSVTPDLIRKLIASMDGLSARFDKGLVIEAYGGA